MKAERNMYLVCQKQTYKKHALKLHKAMPAKMTENQESIKRPGMSIASEK